MHSYPRVTVGLCVKNAAPTVKAAVKSILRQDYPHEFMDIIVVDGCSQDNTLSIVKELLAKSDFKYVILRENVGLGYARQMVVDTTNSDYIAWVDGDVILPKDHITKQVYFMEKNPKVGIGRARYGILRREGVVAFLENLPFVVECLKHKKIAPLEISGTEGSIYRVKAIKQVGGFDKRITGAGEDIDVAYRIRSAGWFTCITDAVFYEICRRTWKSLWDGYFWWGYGGHYFFHKKKSLMYLVKMSPVGGFIGGLIRLPLAYWLTRRNVVFLLPFHYVFKRIAWFCGFIKADIDGYGHNLPHKSS
jgi:glycosyltransferase involved in cell wall biosynthesis